MKPDNKAGGPWLYALGLVPVIWFALLIAPAISGGLSEIVSALPAAMNNPFKIVWCEDSVKTVLIFIAAYGLGIGIYLSSRRNYRRGEEHGSAKWGDPRAVNKKYRDKDPFKTSAERPVSGFQSPAVPLPGIFARLPAALPRGYGRGAPDQLHAERGARPPARVRARRGECAQNLPPCLTSPLLAYYTYLN